MYYYCTRILKHIDELEEGWELLQKFLNSYPQSVTSSIVVIHIDWNKEEYRKGRPENRRAPPSDPSEQELWNLLAKQFHNLSCSMYYYDKTMCSIIQSGHFLSIKVRTNRAENRKKRGWSLLIATREKTMNHSWFGGF